MNIMEKLLDRLADCTEEADSIQAGADAEGRPVNEEEAAQIEAFLAEATDIRADIDRRERIEAAHKETVESLNKSQGRKSGDLLEHLPKVSQIVGDDGEVQNRGTPQRGRIVTPYGNGGRVLSNAARDTSRWGWKHYGEYLNAVRHFSVSNGSKVDPRLVSDAPTSYGQEGVGPDGGFAVPPEWRSAIMSLIGTEGSLFGMTDQQQSSSNSITFPVDETTAWQSTGGIQAYWEGEAAQFTQSKPSLKSVTLRLHKLTALVPMTDELLDDAASMAAYVQRKAPEKIDYKITDALVNGNGAGQPLGLLNAPCAVTVAKEGSQVADTLIGANVIKMWARMPARNRRNAVWLVNQDIEPQLLSLNVVHKDGTGAAMADGSPVYIPPGGWSGSPYGTLFGRPVIATEACGTVGDLGDIIFVDLSAYLTVAKVGGVRSDVSIHLWFDYDITAFRFIIRLAGQPWLSAPIARAKGSNTLSTVVLLEAR